MWMLIEIKLILVILKSNNVLILKNVLIIKIECKNIYSTFKNKLNL